MILKRMRATKWAILTEVRNGLLGDGCAQGMGKSRMRTSYILDAGNPSNRHDDQNIYVLQFVAACDSMQVALAPVLKRRFR